MSIKIFIDTNIYMNSIENRDNGVSKSLLIFLKQTDVALYLNDLSILNIHYLTRKSTHRDEIKKRLKTILEEQNIVSIDKFIIEAALDSDFNDFEDGVQYFCAKRAGAELIITDNKNDFVNSDIKVMTAKEFVQTYMSSIG
ncbi:MAG: PIN domain-containing protein [Sulfurimonas sp.]|nr:PIN domain-containing protein [Sulfurimonas sp.]MDD3061060.1 PIN domain-containing protein [Sulfurimonas sp.]MDD5203435.1 PIN domain-containing protein [Sulfurimonas sp.]